MKRTLSAWLVALTAAGATGCGTICNFAGGLIHPDTEPRVYGGVRRDLEVIEDLSHHPLFPDGTSFGGNSSPGAAVVLGCCLGAIVADPVLSFAGDTMTLPVTLWLQSRRQPTTPSDAPGPALPPGTAPVPPGEPHAAQVGNTNTMGSAWIEQFLNETPPPASKGPPGATSALMGLRCFETELPPAGSGPLEWPR